MIKRILLFLILNFIALGIGSLFTGEGVPSEWYGNLNKAPWTPPGWFFGVAWTSIMICFAFYMAYLWPLIHNKKSLLGLFFIQWLLNISWNPAFFYFHNILVGLIIIISLTMLIGFIFLHHISKLNAKSSLLLPYFIWLIIASSLNAYAYFMN